MHSAALTTLFFALNNSLCVDFRSQRCLVLGAQPHPELKSFSDLVCEQSFFPTYRSLRALGIEVAREVSGSFAITIVLVQRNARATLADLARAIELTELGGSVVIIGENDLGAKRFQEPLSRLLGSVEVITKNHCRIMIAVRKQILDPELLKEHLQLAQPFVISGSNVWSSHYGFSATELDDGSRLLIEHLPNDLQGNGADLGASSGYLSDSVLARAPAGTHMSLFEAEWRLLSLASRTLSVHSQSSYELIWSDINAAVTYNEAADGVIAQAAFDFVITNPPFHIGSKTEPRIAARFIEVAHTMLKPQGRLLVVANRAFPYEQALARFGSWELIVKQRGYAICACVK